MNRDSLRYFTAVVHAARHALGPHRDERRLRLQGDPRHRNVARTAPKDETRDFVSSPQAGKEDSAAEWSAKKPRGRESRTQNSSLEIGRAKTSSDEIKLGAQKILRMTSNWARKKGV